MAKIEDRLKYMLISDKHFDSNEFVKVLTSDLFELMQNYFELNIEDINLNLDVDKINNSYKLNFELKSDRLKIFGTQIN